MGPYEHGGDVYSHPGVIDFSASLNPLGMPGAARAALAGCADACERYPDPRCRALVAALARYEGVAPAQVVACAGATDALARICQALRPRRALVCAPCYGGYEQALGQVGCEVLRHRLAAESGFSVDAAFAQAIVRGVDLVFLANPNNPTGRALDRAVFLACLERAREAAATVVVDECFVELSDGRRSNDLLADHGNLVIVKALTKTHALAGLRVGHALCADSDLARRLADAGQPWAVSVLAQLVGSAALGEPTYLARSRAYVDRERRRLARGMGSLGLAVVPSGANFLLAHGPRGLAGRLLGRGILVRGCENFPGLDPDWFRVAVRTAPENDRLLAALEAVVG